MNKHEREAADLVVEVIGGGGVSETVATDASEYSLSENAKRIDWDKVDEDTVMESKIVQKAVRALLSHALSGLRQ